MNRLFLASALTLSLLTSACGEGEGDFDSRPGSSSTTTTTTTTITQKQKLLGTWAAPKTTFTVEGEQVSTRLSLKFESNRVVATNVCEFQYGPVLTVETASAATIDEKQIRISTSTENELIENGYRCTVTLNAVTFDYEVSGSALVLTTGGENYAFTREAQ